MPTVALKLAVRLFERPVWPASWFKWAFNAYEDRLEAAALEEKDA